MGALALSASAVASLPSTFDILPGSLHRGGVLTALPQSQSGNDVLISMAYEIFKKTLVPVPSSFLRGTYDQKLPASFLSEHGYLELEKVKSLHIDEAVVEHLGRVNVRNLRQAHAIHIIPDNHRSEMFLIYHPGLPGLGWDQLKLILHTEVPLLGDYVIEGSLRQ